MPNNFSVSLDVRNFASNGSDGYTNTTASNGNTYSYQAAFATSWTGASVKTQEDFAALTGLDVTQAQNYYVTSTSDDAASGLSSSTAWRTTRRATRSTSRSTRAAQSAWRSPDPTPADRSSS